MIYRVIKRSFDIISSMLAVILLSPLFLIVSTGIRMSSRGPVLFRSERTGLDGKAFTMLKFRSMHIKQEGVKESQFIVNSDRIFPFGRFLRKSKLDELPQLINVLRGDMSIVGPRPYPQSVVDREYTGEYSAVLSVKPGLSCFDSLFDYTHGELFVTDEKQYSEEIIPVRTELARMYVEERGILTDAAIIGRTLILIWSIVILRRTKFSYSATEQRAISRVRMKTAKEDNRR